MRSDKTKYNTVCEHLQSHNQEQTLQWNIGK